LNGDGQAARDELKVFLDTSTQEATRFNEKREIYFEKQTARGIKPIRLQ
jgi:hypothetical protein